VHTIENLSQHVAIGDCAYELSVVDKKLDMNILLVYLTNFSRETLYMTYRSKFGSTGIVQLGGAGLEAGAISELNGVRSLRSE
jgi:hypothetical protein